MLLLRLIGFVVLVTVLVSWGLYLVKRDPRYLRFAWQVIKLAFVLLLVVATLVALERLVLVI